MSTDSARLVDELTTLLYEPLKGKCLTHTPCVIVACGACHQKADKPEAVVHENDCPVYRLQRAEAANTAVIRANADEIADLEDVRDDLEANVNALSAQVVALREAGAVLAEYVEHQPFSLARLAAIEAWRAALAAAPEARE